MGDGGREPAGDGLRPLQRERAAQEGVAVSAGKEVGDAVERPVCVVLALDTALCALQRVVCNHDTGGVEAVRTRRVELVVVVAAVADDALGERQVVCRTRRGRFHRTSSSCLVNGAAAHRGYEPPDQLCPFLFPQDEEDQQNIQSRAPIPPSSPLPCSRNPALLFFFSGPPGPIGPAPLFSSRSCSFSSRALPVSPPPRPATAPPEYGFRYPTLARTCGPSGIRRSRVSGCCGSTVAVQPAAGSMDVGVCMSASPRGWAHSADPCGPFSRCPVPRRSSGGPSPESRGR